MISQADLDRFYENLVATIQARGGTCAITSGMACVQYGVAQSTKDCDVLCAADSVDSLLNLLKETKFQDVACAYRGHITPPLDPRWLRGGWTAHFHWEVGEGTPYLDVFSVAPRASTDWRSKVAGRLAAMDTVAEMKRTDRPKDWPFATSLGVKLLEEGDLRGWSHVFDASAMRDLYTRVPLTDAEIARRPCLVLLRENDPRLDLAVFAEMVFWQNLDRSRMRIYEAAVRKYFMAVKKDPAGDSSELATQHAVRVRHAERLLPVSPLKDYGLDRLVAEAKAKTAEFVVPGGLEWLPDATAHFVGLE